MTRHFLHKLWPLALLAALVLTACGGSSSRPDDSQTSAVATKTGTATVSVQFPQTLAKALIDDRTSNITLNWYSLDGYYQNFLGTTDLTPATPTATVEVPVGPVMFEAIAFRTNPISGSQIEMARASTAGQIVGGNTDITLRFLLGDWEFVGADDLPLPLTMNNSTGTISMRGFSLNGFQQYYPPQGMASKSAIDYTKPVGWADYSMRWYKDDGAGNPVPMGNPDWGYHDSQFVSDGTTTVTASLIESDGVILDTPIPTGEPIGKRVAFIVGGPPNPDELLTGSTGQNLIPSITPIADSRDLDGTHMAGHLIELTFDNRTDVVTQSNVDCTLYWNQMSPAATPAAARSQAVKQLIAASAGVRKAAPGAVTTIDSAATLTYTDCRSGIQDGDGDGDFYSDYLSYDANSNGVYEPQNGDQYIDYNNDNNYDWLIYPTVVDGDGDGDMIDDYLTYDANFNFRLDPGDTFTDTDGDGFFDFTYYAGELVDVTEQYSNIVAREFRAKANYVGTVFQPVAVSGMYLQYRTYEGGTGDRHQAWVEYKSGGQNIEPSEIANVQLFDPSGTELFASPQPNFYATKFLNANWDGTQFGATTSNGFSGYAFNLSGYPSLAGGDYTFVTTLANGRTLTSTVNFPGTVAVPVVLSSTMTYTWNGDGSLTLNWAAPTGGSFDSYRIALVNPTTGLEIFFGSAAPSATSATLSATLLQSIMTNAGLPLNAPFNWVMQTRNFTGTVNTSRGYSNPVPIGVSGGGDALGAWIHVDPTSGNLAIVGFLDASTYLEGENGIADVGGGPGMERGSYVYNPLNGDTTFTVQYETNGDWGPATLGVPMTFSVAVSGDTMTVYDPIKPETIIFNRVVPYLPNPVVGAWYFNNADPALLILLNNGEYYIVQDSSTDPNYRGYESGTFTWNSVGGAFTATGIFSSFAPGVSLAAPGTTSTGMTVTISGNTLTLVDPTSTTWTATRL